MGDVSEWHLLAIGDDISEVKKEGLLRLLNEFGIQGTDISDDDFRIDPMQNIDRQGDSYRIFIRWDVLRIRQL
jgi:hypothetical protein